jgi:hypothetical protein
VRLSKFSMTAENIRHTSLGTGPGEIYPATPARSNSDLTQNRPRPFFQPIPQESREPQSMNEFQSLSGADQDLHLENWLRSGQLEKVNAARPDMRIFEPLTESEVEGTRAIQEWTDPLNRMGNRWDALSRVFVHAGVTNESAGDVKRAMIEEQYRRSKTPGLYYSHEAIGTLEPARRHLALLLDKVSGREQPIDELDGIDQDKLFIADKAGRYKIEAALRQE